MMTYSRELKFKENKINLDLPIFTASLDLNDNMLKLALSGIYDEFNKKYPSIESNVKSKFTSSWFSHKENYKFTPLVEFTEGCCNTIVKNYYNQDWTVECLNCWGSIYEKGDFAVEHNHFPNHLGACVYLDMDKNSSNIKFANTEIQIKKGTIIIFPGILNHQVLPTEGKRVVVAMNLNKK